MKILEAIRNILIACKLYKPSYFKAKQNFLRHCMESSWITFYDKCLMLSELTDLVVDVEEPDLSNEIVFLLNENMELHNTLGLQHTLYKFSNHTNKKAIMEAIRENPHYLEFSNLEAYFGLPPLSKKQRKLLISKRKLKDIERDF